MGISAGALTSTASFRDWAPIDQGRALGDLQTLVEEAINAASNRIETACRRTFKQATHTAEVYSGTGSSLLRLRQAPITSVTAVAIGGSDLATDSYEISPSATALVYLGGSLDDLATSALVWPVGRRNITVSYVAGYVTTPIEVDIACRMLALRIIESKSPRSEEKARNDDTDALTGLPKDVWDLIRGYKFSEVSGVLTSSAA